MYRSSLNTGYDSNNRSSNYNQEEEDRNFRRIIRLGEKNEQRSALARMTKPRGPLGISMKQEIEAAAGAGSPAELSRYAAYLSRQRGVPLSERNVAVEYAQQKGVFNENKYPSAVATGPRPSGRATRRLMRRIPWVVKELPENYDESPTTLTGPAANLYTIPEFRWSAFGLEPNAPLSKAQRNAAEEAYNLWKKGLIVWIPSEGFIAKEKAVAAAGAGTDAVAAYRWGRAPGGSARKGGAATRTRKGSRRTTQKRKLK